MIGILTRELRLSVRHGADTLAALLFFLLIVSLFPFAIGPEPVILKRGPAPHIADRSVQVGRPRAAGAHAGGRPPARPPPEPLTRRVPPGHS